jgi:hypothetical protein
MKINRATKMRLPELRLIRDPNTKKVLDQLTRVVHDSFSKLYDDLFQLSEKMRHTVSDAAITLTEGGVYVFTGSSAKAWTLPDLVRETEKAYFIKNRGSDTVTLTRAGTDEIWDTSAVTTLAIAAGTSYLVTSDGTYWIVFDLN